MTTVKLKKYSNDLQDNLYTYVHTWVLIRKNKVMRMYVNSGF